MQSDVVVVGAGPAGIATAIAAALKGLQTTVLDFRKPPIDKPCGEGLLPEAAEALESLGIDLSRSAFPFSGIRFSDDQSSVRARIAGRAYGLQRRALHQLLVERATALQVRFLWSTRVSEFHADHLRIGDQSLSFRWLVGADGQNSAVRKWAGLNPRRRAHSRFGFRRHYAVKPWTDCVEVHWGERCQMFVTPTGEEEVCVALLANDPQMRIDRALAQFPEVANRLRCVEVIGQEAGAVSVLGRARAVVRGNVALVGDASCAIDGIAGQGLSLAFQQAIALGDALAREDMPHYVAGHRQITANAVRMTRLLLLMGSSVTLRRKVLRLFAKNPTFFSRMMAIHTRESREAALKARDVVGLGWRILWA
jgi:flavin-dependent dehydrogenase